MRPASATLAHAVWAALTGLAAGLAAYSLQLATIYVVSGESSGVVVVPMILIGGSVLALVVSPFAILGVLAFGLPIHGWLLHTGKTRRLHYLVAAGLAGGALSAAYHAVLPLFSETPNFRMANALALPFVIGGIGAAWLFWSLHRPGGAAEADT